MMTIIKFIISFFFLIGCFSTSAQKVSNIRAEQRGQDIVVFYSLETTSSCEVSLLLSQDNGFTWSAPLKNVSGDVGKNISAGEKQIIWKVLEEKELLVGDKIKFKVIVSSRKSFEPELVFVEGGTFQMGSNSGEEDEKPVHKVTLNSFSIGKYEVTKEQWNAVMGNHLSVFSDCVNCPVEDVSWEDIQVYLQKLKQITGRNYRLPTEAEWEYAAKGGLKSNGYVYSGSNNIDEVAWSGSNSLERIHSVGSKKSNELGIYDMSGNVWEWCSDWRGSYVANEQINPKGPSNGETRVLRGGSWNYWDSDCRNLRRYRSFPYNKIYSFGFRLVLQTN